MMCLHAIGEQIKGSTRGPVDSYKTAVFLTDLMIQHLHDLQHPLTSSNSSNMFDTGCHPTFLMWNNHVTDSCTVLKRTMSAQMLLCVHGLLKI